MFNAGMLLNKYSMRRKSNGEVKLNKQDTFYSYNTINEDQHDQSLTRTSTWCVDENDLRKKNRTISMLMIVIVCSETLKDISQMNFEEFNPTHELNSRLSLTSHKTTRDPDLNIISPQTVAN